MNTKTKIGLTTAAIVVLASSIFYYVATHEFHFRTPVILQKPLSITRRTTPAPVVERVLIDGDAGLPLNPNDRYLCRTFGPECKTALLIQRFENRSQACDAYHVNPNGSVDFGVMQVNSVHIGQTIDGHKITLAELVDCQKNVDDAYLIWKHSTWNAWTTYKLIR